MESEVSAPPEIGHALHAGSDLACSFTLLHCFDCWWLCQQVCTERRSVKKGWPKFFCINYMGYFCNFAHRSSLVYYIRPSVTLVS